MGKIDDIIKLAQTSTDIARRNKQKKKFNAFLDNYEDEVLAKIKKQFHEDNYDRLYKMAAAYYNVFKKVINSKSLLYKKEAIREWLKRDGKTPDDKYTEFIGGTNLHTASQMINKYANANNVSFMRLKPNYENQVIEYEAIPAENIVVLRDEVDPFKIMALMHKIVGDSGTYWLYFDEEMTAKIDEDFGKVYDQQENYLKDPNHSNTGIIPYIPVWATPPMANDFWNYTVNDDLYNVTIQLNVHLTHFNNTLKLACYKQLAFLGLQTEDIKRLYNHVTDGLNPVALTGEKTDVKALLMTENLTDFIDSIDSIASRVLDQHGFDFEVQSKSAQKSSGISIKLRQDALNDLKEEQQPLFREYEKKVAYYTVVIANQEFKTGMDLNGKLRINFWEEEEGLEPDDIAAYDWLMRNGIKSIEEVFQKFNPDVDPDEIEDTIKANKEQYNALMGAAEPADQEIEQAFNEAQGEEE